MRSLTVRAGVLVGLAVASCALLLGVVVAVVERAQATGDWRLVVAGMAAAALVHGSVLAGLGLLAVRWILRPAEAAMRLQLEVSEQARRHSEAQARFLATMSHELRTPLNSVLGFAQMLESAPLDERQARYLENIQRSGAHLLELINDVLDLAKVRFGDLTLHNDVVSVGEIVGSVAMQMEPLALARRIEIRVEPLAREAEFAYGDPRRMRQVLINLVGNAVKFSPEGTTVTVRADILAGRLSIAVGDRGPGVAEKDRERIFDEFEQLDSGRARAHEGTGLGLALSRRLARAMQGDVVFEPNCGGGSVFRLLLPLRTGIDRLAV